MGQCHIPERDRYTTPADQSRRTPCRIFQYRYFPSLSGVRYASLNIEALSTLPRPSRFARQKMQSGTGDMKCWVEPDSPSAFNPQVQLDTKIPVVDSWRVMSSPHYSTNGIRPTSFRSWLSLVLLTLVCVFISRKAPSTPSLDLLTQHPELSSQIFSIERDIVPLSVIKTNVSDNGLTDEVQWDGYSLLLRGQRIFLQ